jgi:hypothetical protein
MPASLRRGDGDGTDVTDFSVTAMGAQARE